MKITLLNIKSSRKECINKDFMGGYGWAFNAGNSLAARLINFVKKQGESLPLMSFGYLAAILSGNNHKVDFKTNIIPDADMALISSSMVDYRHELDWARKIKAKGINVGFIGPFASFKPDLFLNDCDFVIKGEPEGLALNIKEDVFLKGIIESKPVEELDSLPFPKWDIFPVASYSYLPALKERPFLPILASRGCAYGCNYCPYIITYKYRRRSAENVFEEVKYLKSNFKIKGMLFRDPLFGADRGFVQSFCEMMIKENIRLRWACETKLDLLEEVQLDLMHKAGLRVINTGIESSNTDIIRDSSRKEVKKSHQERIVRYCDKIGIRMTAFYILGLPLDTVASIKETICYAKYLDTNVAQFFIHTPFPGTEYFEQVKSEIIEDDWERFDCYTPVLRHRNLSREQLLALKEEGFIKYYYRLEYLKKFVGRAIRDLFS